MRVYRVLLKQDEDVWFVSIPEVPGCHSQGKTIHQALERIREALGSFVDDVDEAKLEAVMPESR